MPHFLAAKVKVGRYATSPIPGTGACERRGDAAVPMLGYQGESLTIASDSRDRSRLFPIHGRAVGRSVPHHPGIHASNHPSIRSCIQCRAKPTNAPSTTHTWQDPRDMRLICAPLRPPLFSSLQSTARPHPPRFRVLAARSEGIMRPRLVLHEPGRSAGAFVRYRHGGAVVCAAPDGGECAATGGLRWRVSCWRPRARRAGVGVGRAQAGRSRIVLARHGRGRATEPSERRTQRHLNDLHIFMHVRASRLPHPPAPSPAARLKLVILSEPRRTRSPSRTF